MKSPRVDMINGPILGNVIRYTIPIIVSSLLQLLFNAADLVVVGRFCGSITLAAVGVTGPLTSLLVNFFIGLSVGVGVTVAQAIGAGDERSVHRTIHAAVPLVLVCGGVLTVFGVAMAKQFLVWMGTPADVLPLATLYTRIIFSGLLFSLSYNFLAAILRAAGDTQSPMVFLTIAGVVNVILNLVFVLVFHMSVDGVALATILSQAVSAVALLIVLMKRTDACRFVWNKMRFYAEPIKRILLIGVPAGLQSMIFALSNVLIQSSVNSLGSVVMSGNAAAGNIDAFIWTAINGFHQSAVNFAGQNVGAGQYARTRRVLGVCLACGMATGVLLSAIAYLFGPQLLSLYITDSAEAISYGMVRLTVLGWMYVFCAFMDISTGVLRGMGASVVPMLISVVGVCGFRIAWIYLVFPIPAFHTLEMLYVQYGISWVLTGIAQIVVFFLLYRRHMHPTAKRSRLAAK